MSFRTENTFAWLPVLKNGAFSFELNAFFAINEDWRHDYRTAVMGLRDLIKQCHHRNVHFRMIVRRTDKCPTEYWSAPALANELHFLDNIGTDGCRMVNSNLINKNVNWVDKLWTQEFGFHHGGSFTSRRGSLFYGEFHWRKFGNQTQFDRLLAPS